MKRQLITIAAILALTLAVGCGEASGTPTSKREFKKTSGVQDVLNAGVAAEEAKKNTENSGGIYYDKETGEVPDSVKNSGKTSEPENPGIAPEAANPEEGIDVDLTRLSSTMVYSEVYNMMVYPENYMGKTVKMSGIFNYLYDEVNDFYYFSCVIADATACCAQGIEFVTTEEFSYPEDYPEFGEDITVIGVFDTYREGNALYATLRNAKIL